jgi:hypothetical protein
MGEEKKKIPPPPPWPDGPIFDVGAPRAAFFDLLALLEKREILPVDEATRLMGVPAEKIEEYTRLYPASFLWLDGPSPAIAKVAKKA